MEITTELRKRIKEKREELGYSIKDLIEKTIPLDGDKPAISISTISSIERGDLKNIKLETYERIAGVLGLEKDDEALRDKPLRVSFGNCLWASPILNNIVSEPFTNKESELLIDNIEFTCYAGLDGEPHFLKNFNEKPNADDNAIFTAHETLTLLENEEVDISFLPITTTSKSSNLVKIAKCMNTVKGGVYLFIIGKKGKEETYLEGWDNDPVKFDYRKLNQIKEILEFNDPNATESEMARCRFVTPKNSIAQIEIEKTLYEQASYDKHTIDISTLSAFRDDMYEKITTFFGENNKHSKYFVFAGWDYHIHQLDKMFGNTTSSSDSAINLFPDLQRLIGKSFDGYRFTKYGYPYAQISYDCVMLESKSDYIKNHKGLKTLLNLLNKNVKELNEIKHSKFNSRYRMIAEFLDMDTKFVNDVLKRINWEFSIYPEMYDKDLK